MLAQQHVFQILQQLMLEAEAEAVLIVVVQLVELEVLVEQEAVAKEEILQAAKLELMEL